MEYSSFFETFLELVGFHFHEFAISCWHKWFWCLLLVIVHWWTTVGVYFFSYAYGWWFYWNVVLLRGIGRSCIRACSWFISIERIFLFLHLLLLILFPFLLNLLLFLQCSSVLPLLFFFHLLDLFLIFSKWVWVSILKCCFFVNILRLYIFLWWRLCLLSWFIIQTVIFVLMKLLLQFFLFFFSNVFILLIIYRWFILIGFFDWPVVSIALTPERILIEAWLLLKLKFLKFPFINNRFLLFGLNWPFHRECLWEEWILIKWRWIL